MLSTPTLILIYCGEGNKYFETGKLATSVPQSPPPLPSPIVEREGVGGVSCFINTSDFPHVIIIGHTAQEYYNGPCEHPSDITVSKREFTAEDS